MEQTKTGLTIDEMWDPEYNKGFHDGLGGKNCRPTSRLYLRGYERGRESAKIGKYHGHAKIPDDEE